MYVCVCRAVTSQQISSAISNGCTTLREIGQCTGAASQCGLCAPYICQTLRAEKNQQADSQFHGVTIHLDSECL